MLEKPSIPDEIIADALQEHYGLFPIELTFLPIGADLNTAAYRVVAAGGSKVYFLKLRRGIFDATSVTLPRWLFDQGIPQIIPPLPAASGQLRASLGDFTLILYPFVEGRDGYAVPLSDRQWVEFGAALKKIHTAKMPPALIQNVRRETYSPSGRQAVRRHLAQLESRAFVDPVAVEMAAFLSAKREEVLDLVARAGALAHDLQARPLPFILCHSDLHAGNVLVDARGALYIVDWDDPILAPVERDLMYPGGAQGFIGHTPQQEEALFYQGYGPTQVDARALAYYRCERIVQDIAIYCDQIFQSGSGGEDRRQAFVYLKSNFLPGNTIEMAYRSDGTRLTFSFPNIT